MLIIKAYPINAVAVLIVYLLGFAYFEFYLRAQKKLRNSAQVEFTFIQKHTHYTLL